MFLIKMQFRVGSAWSWYNFLLTIWILQSSGANFVQDKLIMVSSSTITNCQLSTKMIERSHFFGSEGSCQGEVYYHRVCTQGFMLHHVQDGGRKCYLMQNSCIGFKSSDFSFVLISSSGCYPPKNLCNCLKSEEICVKHCKLCFGVGDGLLSLEFCVLGQTEPQGMSGL